MPAELNHADNCPRPRTHRYIDPQANERGMCNGCAAMGLFRINPRDYNPRPTTTPATENNPVRLARVCPDCSRRPSRDQRIGRRDGRCTPCGDAARRRPNRARKRTNRRDPFNPDLTD